MGCISGGLGKGKPYLLSISLQFGYAGMYIITALCFKRGMNPFILSLYRHLFATLVVVPFALFLERKTRERMTLSVFWKVALLGFIGPMFNQNLYYQGLKYTSASFASISVNVLPAITFIMAIIFRLEKIKIKKLGSQAKIIGTIVTLSGAMLMTVYRGPVVKLIGVDGEVHESSRARRASSTQDWVLGTLLLLGSSLGWAGFFILQSYTLKEYPSELSLTAWICLMGAVEAGVISLAMVRKIKDWALAWDSRLLASFYTGVVCSGIAYYVHGVVNREKGPVFVTMFTPLCMIITAALGYIILNEQLHLGSIIGAVIIVIGLYTVVWGKSKDEAVLMESTNDKELPIIMYFNLIAALIHKDDGQIV